MPPAGNSQALEKFFHIGQKGHCRGFCLPQGFSLLVLKQTLGFEAELPTKRVTPFPPSWEHRSGGGALPFAHGRGTELPTRPPAPTPQVPLGPFSCTPPARPDEHHLQDRAGRNREGEVVMLEEVVGAKKRCSDSARSLAAVRAAQQRPRALSLRQTWEPAEQRQLLGRRALPAAVAGCFPATWGPRATRGCVELCRDLWSPQASWSTRCHHVKKETKVAQAEGKPPPRSHSSSYTPSHPRCPSAEI